MSAVDSVLLAFLDFLNASARSAIAANSNEYIYGDWLQANWEILVESRLEFTLDVYGSGADCNDRSSRVWAPEKTATHKVVFSSRSDPEIKYDFDQFVCVNDGKWADKPPYIHVIGGREMQIVMDAFEVNFTLIKIES